MRKISKIRARLVMILVNKVIKDPLGVSLLSCFDLIVRTTSKPLSKDSKKQECLIFNRGQLTPVPRSKLRDPASGQIPALEYHGCREVAAPPLSSSSFSKARALFAPELARCPRGAPSTKYPGTFSNASRAKRASFAAALKLPICLR